MKNWRDLLPQDRLADVGEFDQQFLDDVEIFLSTHQYRDYLMWLLAAQDRGLIDPERVSHLWLHARPPWV